MQACPADTQGESGRDAQLGCDPDAPSPRAEASAVRKPNGARRTPAPGRKEQETRALLVGVPLKATMGISAVAGLQLVHDRTLTGRPEPCLINSGNYT